jgi:hypothetical protein
MEASERLIARAERRSLRITKADGDTFTCLKKIERSSLSNLTFGPCSSSKVTSSRSGSIDGRFMDGSSGSRADLMGKNSVGGSLLGDDSVR